MSPAKILIGGSSSIGKSTLAAELARRFSIPYWRLDDVRRMNPCPEFNKLLDPYVWQNETSVLVDIIKDIGTRLEPFIVAWCKKQISGILEGEGIEPDIELEVIGEEGTQWAIDYLQSGQ